MAISRKVRPRSDPLLDIALNWRQGWRGRMLRKYTGLWIAIRGKRVVATGRTYDSLADKLKKLKVGPVVISREEASVVVY